MTAVYHRAQHAAHYAPAHPAMGHDLETWTIAAPIRPAFWMRVADGIPSDATYSHGFLENGVQHWVYSRTAPLTGDACERCRS